MSRTLSSVVKTALYAQDTAEVFLFLVTISHSSIATIRLVNDMQNITHAGDVYTAYPFEIALPDDLDDALPHVLLIAENIDQQIISALRTIPTAPDVTLKIVLASDPNTAIVPAMDFKLREFSYDAQTIQARLAFEYLLNEPFPGYTFTPREHPALFREAQ